MADSDSDDQFLSSLSPRIKHHKKALSKGPRFLSLKKHFRRSSIFDRTKPDVINDSMVVIEISSTDSDCSQTMRTNNLSQAKKINESYDEKFSLSGSEGTPSHVSDSNPEEISPTQNEGKGLKYSSTKKKLLIHTSKYDVLPTKKNFEIEKWIEDVNKTKHKPLKPTNMSNLGEFEATLLSYEDFEQKRICAEDNEMNSTMLTNSKNIKEKTNSNLLFSKKIVNENKEENKSDDDSCDQSCEDLLDKLYGDSWRNKRNEILPQSEKKPRKKMITETKKMPESERKPKTDIYRNPYLETEKSKSNNLFKILQTKRIKEAIESPFLNRLKNLCDEESEEESFAKSKTKLNFDGKQDNFETPQNELRNNKIQQIENLTNLERDADVKVIDNPILSDEEVSFLAEFIPLEVRIKSKKSNKNTYEGSQKCTNKTDLQNIKEQNLITQEINLKKNSRKTVKKLYFTDSDNELNEKNYINTASGYGDINIKDSIKIQSITKNKGNYRNRNEIPSSSSSTTSSSSSTKNCIKTPIEILDEKKVTKKKTYNYSSDSSDSSEERVVQKEKPSDQTKPKIFSFLQSLSKSIPDSQCDQSARIFRNNFAQNKDQLARKLFDMFNEKVFDNSLPKTTSLGWNARMLSTAGFCYTKKITHRDGTIDRESNIVFSSKVVDCADRLRDTIIHEMCHAATWIINHESNGHGPLWKAWAHKAGKAFPELPPIRTCHNYKINKKYVYRCTNCGYSIGRHRKTLDTDRKRCGYCFGKFEVLINKTNKKGEQKTVPVGQKKEPTGFALFVKENYSKFKSPGVNHANVMRLLSENFNKLKV